MLCVERYKLKYYETYDTKRRSNSLSHHHIIVNILCVETDKLYTTLHHSKDKIISNNNNVAYFNSFVVYRIQ